MQTITTAYSSLMGCIGFQVAACVRCSDASTRRVRPSPRTVLREGAPQREVSQAVAGATVVAVAAVVSAAGGALGGIICSTPGLRLPPSHGPTRGGPLDEWTAACSHRSPQGNNHLFITTRVLPCRPSIRVHRQQLPRQAVSSQQGGICSKYPSTRLYNRLWPTL